MAPWLFALTGWMLMGFMNLSGYQSRFVVTEAGRLHYFEAAGTGHLPPVLLLHGIGSQASDLYLLTEQLRPRFRKVIALDLPGHGYSEVAVDKLPLAKVEAGFMQAMDQLLAQEPAIVFGNSFGGWQALNYALHRPGRVRSLVLISPAGAVLGAQQFARLQRIFAHDTLHDPDSLVRIFFNQPPLWGGVASTYIKTRFERPALRALMAGFSPETHLEPEALSRLPMPILLIWGKQDRLFPSEVSFFKQHLPPSTQVLEPAHFTHNPYVEAGMEHELARMIEAWEKGR